jgi:hypothetical protein
MLSNLVELWWLKEVILVLQKAKVSLLELLQNTLFCRCFVSVSHLSTFLSFEMLLQNKAWGTCDNGPNPPTESPFASPTASPTNPPTAAPSASPTNPPTAAPSASPTTPPTAVPSASPTDCGMVFKLDYSQSSGVSTSWTITDYQSNQVVKSNSIVSNGLGVTDSGCFPSNCYIFTINGGLQGGLIYSLTVNDHFVGASNNVINEGSQTTLFGTCL